MLSDGWRPLAALPTCLGIDTLQVGSVCQQLSHGKKVATGRRTAQRGASCSRHGRIYRAPVVTQCGIKFLHVVRLQRRKILLPWLRRGAAAAHLHVVWWWAVGSRRDGGMAPIRGAADARPQGNPRTLIYGSCGFAERRRRGKNTGGEGEHRSPHGGRHGEGHDLQHAGCDACRDQNKQRPATRCLFSSRRRRRPARPASDSPSAGPCCVSGLRQQSTRGFAQLQAHSQGGQR